MSYLFLLLLCWALTQRRRHHCFFVFSSSLPHTTSFYVHVTPCPTRPLFGVLQRASSSSLSLSPALCHSLAASLFRKREQVSIHNQTQPYPPPQPTHPSTNHLPSSQINYTHLLQRAQFGKHLPKLARPGQGHRVVPPTNALPIEKDIGHGAAAREVHQSGLDGPAVLPRVELNGGEDRPFASQRLLGLGGVRAVRLGEDDDLVGCIVDWVSVVGWCVVWWCGCPMIHPDSFPFHAVDAHIALCTVPPIVCLTKSMASGVAGADPPSKLPIQLRGGWCGWVE